MRDGLGLRSNSLCEQTEGRGTGQRVVSERAGADVPACVNSGILCKKSR